MTAKVQRKPDLSQNSAGISGWQYGVYCMCGVEQTNKPGCVVATNASERTDPLSRKITGKSVKRDGGNEDRNSQNCCESELNASVFRSFAEQTHRPGSYGYKRKRPRLNRVTGRNVEQPSPESCSQPLYVPIPPLEWLQWAEFGTTRLPAPYLAAELTDFTEMVSPLAVPVTLACSQASLFSSSNAA